MEASGQLHVPKALPPGKEPRDSFSRSIGWLQLEALEKGTKGMENEVMGCVYAIRHV